MPIKCILEEFIYNDEQRLQWRLEEYSESRYENNEDYALCHIVQEIPMYYPTCPGKYVQERINRHSILLEGIYRDMWADTGSESGIFEWSACEGEDKTITKKFLALHQCKKGEIVNVVNDECLTVGIIIDYCNDGCYDMWLWNENQKCIRERVPVSRVLYGIYFVHETEVLDNEIKEELKKKLL